MKTLPFWPIAWTLAVFAAIVFTLDVLLGLLLPNWWVMQKAWELVLPGFTFISWGTFFLGLVESFVGGFLSDLGFVLIYNFFASREAPKTEPMMTPAGQHH
jgi:hypothetical protein